MPEGGALPLTQSHPHSLSHLLNPALDNDPVEAFENVPLGSIVPMGANPAEGTPPCIPNGLHPMDVDPVECPQPDIFNHGENHSDRRNLPQVSGMSASNDDKTAKFASAMATLPMIMVFENRQVRFPHANISVVMPDLHALYIPLI